MELLYIHIEKLEKETQELIIIKILYIIAATKKNMF